MNDLIMQKLDEMQARCGEDRVAWYPTPPPGGYICRWCDMPVESEPCDEHSEEADIRRLIAALRAVLEEHAPERWGSGTVVCSICSWQMDGRVLYPCPTVKASAKALGVEP